MRRTIGDVTTFRYEQTAATSDDGEPIHVVHDGSVSDGWFTDVSVSAASYSWPLPITLSIDLIEQTDVTAIVPEGHALLLIAPYNGNYW